MRRKREQEKKSKKKRRTKTWQQIGLHMKQQKN